MLTRRSIESSRGMRPDAILGRTDSINPGRISCEGQAENLQTPHSPLRSNNSGLLRAFDVTFTTRHSRPAKSDRWHPKGGALPPRLMVSLGRLGMRYQMTYMDDQVARHCKEMIVRATHKSAHDRQQPCGARETLDRAVRVLRDNSAYPRPQCTPRCLTSFNNRKD